MWKINMEVNTSEMMEQIKNNILKSGHYVKLEILVNADEDMPYAKFESKDEEIKTISYLICEAKEIIKKLETIPGVKETEKKYKLDEGFFVLKDNQGSGKEEVWK